MVTNKTHNRIIDDYKDTIDSLQRTILNYEQTIHNYEIMMSEKNAHAEELTNKLKTKAKKNAKKTIK